MVAPAGSPAYPPLRAVIFDLDGTLVDSAPDLAFAANRMLAALGMSGRDPALLATFIGKGIPRLVERALAGSLEGMADPVLMARALPLYEGFYGEESGRRTTVYPGVAEGLELLAREGLPLACVTNKAERFTHALLAGMGLAHFFAVVVGGDTLPKKKPDPLPFRHVCEKLGVAADEALVVGDSRNDVAGARAAGCPVICVPYGYNEGEAVEALDADAIVASVVEAARIVIASRTLPAAVPGEQEARA
jgi:phosphoglycolate phosphatase